MKQMLSLATLGVALAGSSLSHAATIAFEELTSPDTTYNHHAASVRNDTGSTTTANNSSRLLVGTVGNGAMRALFSYDLTAIPTTATINSVSLRIYQEADSGTSVAGLRTVELRTISSSFNEATATWDNTFGAAVNPMTLGASALSSVQMDPEVATVGTEHTFATSAGFVAAVQSAVSGASALNFAMVAPTVEGGPDRAVMRLTSDLANTAGSMIGLRPVLTIDYTEVPEPASLSLLALAGGAMLRRRRA